MLLFMFSSVSAFPLSGQHIELKVQDLLAIPEDEIDLAKTRLTIESLIDPSVNIEAGLQEIGKMVDEIKKVPRYNETTEGKLNGIIQYLYMPGSWNSERPYQYDFDDPLGTTKPENSRLFHFINSRKGNCVSMPLLVLILGEKLGMDMSLSSAPLHLFVRLNDNGDFYNFEATAGGLKQESSFINEFGISKKALENGVYLRSLSKKEAIGVMLTELARHFSQPNLEDIQFNTGLKLTDSMLKLDQNNVTAMIIRGNIWRNILYRDLDAFKLKKAPFTPAIKKHFDELLSRNLKWYEKAESLGWQEPTKEYDEKYLKMVNEARKHYE